MARKQSGGLNKLLNFIGLVDDEPLRDTYGEEYSNGNYGRQAAYTPSRQTRTSRGTTSSRQTTQRRLPETSSRSSRYDTSSRYDDYRETSRPVSRFEDVNYDYDPPRQERVGGRAGRATDSRYGTGESLAPRQPRNMRVSPRSRTVMYSLHSLEDCCEVIDQLIANNTVVLTMDELDGRLMQRAVDTLSGAVFALHASIRKASDKTYLVAPMSVEVNDTYDMDRRF